MSRRVTIHRNGVLRSMARTVCSKPRNSTFRRWPSIVGGARSIVPRRGTVDIAEFHIAGGGGQATAKASPKAGPQGQTMAAEFTVSPMP